MTVKIEMLKVPGTNTYSVKLPSVDIGTFTHNNELTITSSDAGFEFGTKAQAAPVFYWHGRDVWVNGVPRNDYESVNDGDIVPYGLGEVFGNSQFAELDGITFSTDTRYPGSVTIDHDKPQYFGRPDGHSSPLNYSTSYFSWRAKLEENYLDWVAYYHDGDKTGDFIPGEEVTLTNATETFGPAIVKGVGALDRGVTVFESLGAMNADLPATLTGTTSGATATITGWGGFHACKTHRFDVVEGNDQNKYSHVSSANTFAVKTTNDEGVTTQYIDTGIGAGGYHGFRFDTGEWELFECTDFLDAPIGYSFWHVSGENGGKQYANDIDTSDIDFTRYPTLISVGLDSSGGRDKGDVKFSVSDMYLDNTCQRVFISNSRYYSKTDKNIELQLPTSWDNHSITFKCIEGVVDKNEPLYLYIVDDNGYVNGIDVNSFESTNDVQGLLLGGNF